MKTVLVIILSCVHYVSANYVSGMNGSESETEGVPKDLFDVTGYPAFGDIPLLNRKIFRGHRVSIREHPYVVSIRRNFCHYLTGTLITRNLVITVAHPLHNVPIYELGVVVGETYSDRGSLLLTVIVVVIHQKFDPFTLAADLAMIMFYEDITYRSSVKNIQLVGPKFQLAGTAFVTGWGRCDFTGNELCLPRSSEYYPDEKIDPMLRSISVTIAHSDYCDGYKKHDTKVGVGMLCTGTGREEQPTAPCLAVPGAPLVLRAALAGLLSWGFGCGYLHDLPLVYTSVQHYIPWIARNILIFREIPKSEFDDIFQAVKSYVLSKWLYALRLKTPLLHKHSNNYGEFQTIKVDEKLARIQGIPYDIRDFIYNKAFHPTKIKIYNELLKKIMEKSNKTQHEVVKAAQTYEKPRPFLNRTLLDNIIDSDDYSSSDEY